VRRDGAPVTIPGAKPRAILTMLGLHNGSVVSADALVELLWGEDPPRTAAKALQTHISSLRRTLGDGFVLTEGTGWILADSEVDASRYTSAARLGRDAAAGDTSQAVTRFEEVCLVEHLAAADQAAFDRQNADLPPLGVEAGAKNPHWVPTRPGAGEAPAGDPYCKNRSLCRVHSTS